MRLYAPIALALTALACDLPADTGAVAETPDCGDWASMHLDGVVTTLALDNGGTVTLTNAGTQPYGDGVAIVQDVVETGSAAATGEDLYRCDEAGVWLLSRSRTADGETVEWRYSPDPRVSPRVVGVGVSWDTSYTWEIWRDGVLDTSGSVDLTLLGTDTEELELDAGDFEAVKVQIHDGGQPAGILWFAAGIGVVQSFAADGSTAVLTDFAP